MSSENTINVSIVTPETTAFEGTALAVSVPGSQSPFQVLYNHAPIISSLDVGVVKIEDPGNAVTVFATREGFVEVLRNTVNIVVEELVDATTIDASAAEEAVTVARNEYNETSGRDNKTKALNALHWAEAKWRAAKLQNEGAA